MEYLTLGNSGLHVSRACLGTMMFGHSETAPCSEGESRRIIDAFIGDGGNFIDTANMYTSGESEEVVGRAIKGKRDGWCWPPRASALSLKAPTAWDSVANI